VLPVKNYNEYIRDLNECDLSLSPFPFGNTNGVVDSLLQGKPVVNLRGQEIHSLIDGAIVQGLKQPGWLTTSNIEDYVAAVVRIVNDDALRVQLSRNILELNPDKIFFENGFGRVRDFSEIMNSIYQNHESIQNVEKKIWSNADIVKKAQNE
jgi:predicted O-linked N-acetylglucosamine transferase (SPINDLY family)